MIDMKNNPLLDKLIEHAKSLEGGKNTTFTAERYVVSVIDFVSDLSTLEATEAEKNELKALLIVNMPFTVLGFGEVKNHFIQHIKNNKSASYMDGIYMQQHMYKAKEAAKSKGLEELTPEILLECVFSDPNDFIKGVLSSNGNLDLEKKDEETEDASSLVEGIIAHFDDLFAGEANGEGTEKDSPKEYVKGKKLIQNQRSPS